MKRFTNNNGLTLLEVLASIVILSIIVISFMSLFPQMSLFNKKTEENLEAVTIAKELLVEMKSERFTAIMEDPSANLPNGLTVIEYPAADGEFLIIEGKYRGYDTRIIVNPSLTSMENVDGMINYHEMKIDILKDLSVDRPMSSMYGLISH